MMLWMIACNLLVLLSVLVSAKLRHGSGRSEATTKEQTNPQDIHDFSTSYAPELSLILHEARLLGRNNISILEVGISNSISTRWFMENVITDKKTSHIVCIMETWTGKTDYRDFLHSVSQYKKSVTLVQGQEEDTVPYSSAVRSRQYDIIYIDSHQSAKEALTRGTMAWPLLKKGGVMIWVNTFLDNNLNKPGVDVFIWMHIGQLQIMSNTFLTGVKKLV